VLGGDQTLPISLALGETSRFYPSRQGDRYHWASGTLTKNWGPSFRTIQKKIAKEKSAGEIRPDKRYAKGGSRTNWNKGVRGI